MQHITIGLGEVGTAINKIFGGDGWDMNKEGIKGKTQSGLIMLHICFPYNENEDFIGQVKAHQEHFNAHLICVHSTVPVGTCKKVESKLNYETPVVHSPIRGIHPNLYEGIKTFVKFIGGEHASQFADEFRRKGLKVMLFDKSETTELGKLLDTEYYRACIEFALKSKELCNKHEVPYSEAYTLFNMTYNDGYTKLGHPEYVRPVLEAIMKPIGGHCVLPNKKLLENG